MKTITKLLKITGTLCLSCICLTSKAELKIMTLEELRNSFEESRERIEVETNDLVNQVEIAYGEWLSKYTEVTKKIESSTNKKTLRKGESTDSSLKAFSDEDFTFNLDDLKKQAGFKNEYNAEGEPISIDFVGSPFFLLKEAIYPDTKRPSSYTEYNKERLKQKPCGLNKISHLLEKEDLKKREITDKELECLGKVSIHEITFDSILKSGFFSEKDVKRAEKLYENDESFFKAVERYVNQTTVWKTISVNFQIFEVDVDFEADEENKTVKYCKQLKEFKRYKENLTYKVVGDGKVWLKEILEDCAYTQGGKEMIILLLLLENITPPAFRLVWRMNEGRMNEEEEEEEGSCYMPRINMISLRHTLAATLLHEIGHYLQFHFGLTQTFESYRNTFAKKLLLLEHKSKENKVLSVPQTLSNLFEEFESSCNENVRKDFNEEDLFMRWQLISRWNSSDEISNILGVYFDQSNIYVNNLSEIRHNKYLRYGCVQGYDLVQKKLDKIEFDNPESKNVFEEIVSEAKKKRPEQYLIELLCKLHGVKFHKFVNEFDGISIEEEVELMVKLRLKNGMD